MIYFWIMIVIMLTIVEAATINLVTIWFVASALLALITSIFTDNMLLQFGIFSIIGFILLITTRPLLKRLLKTEDVKTNLDRVVGMKGIVTEDILPMKSGEIKVDGKKWTAISNQELLKDSIVKVLEIEGVKLKVEKWEE